jgi:hypothetical protein
MIRKPTPALSLLVILLLTANAFSQTTGTGKKRMGLTLLFGGSAVSIYGSFAKRVQTSETISRTGFQTPSQMISICYGTFPWPNPCIPPTRTEVVTENHRRPNWIIVGSGAGTAVAGVFLFRAGSKKSKVPNVALGPERVKLTWAW